jgi:hypothetical protein
VTFSGKRHSFYQDGIAREAHVRLAGVIDEEHDRLVLGLLQSDKVKAVSDPAPKRC